MPGPMPLYATLNEWIAREAQSFSIDESGAFDAAVARLLTSLGDRVELLGFGEALHGSEETLILRNRLFQRLAEAHGYSAIAIESSFPRGRIANDYVLGRGPATFAEIQETGFSHNFGRLDANRELIEWMRAYNADPAHPTRLHFYGVDSPSESYSTDSPRQLLLFPLDYLASLADPRAHQRRERIETLLGPDAAWENPAALMDPSAGIGLSDAANALRLETEELITALQLRRPELIARGGADRFLEALHYASIARLFLTYHAGLARASDDRLSTLLGIRDAIMADNLAYTVARERGRGRVLAFAHNQHLQRTQPIEWQLGPQLLTWWPAGATSAPSSARATPPSAPASAPPRQRHRPARTRHPRSPAHRPARPRPLPPHPPGPAPPRPRHRRPPHPHRQPQEPRLLPLTPASLTNFDALTFLHTTTYNRGGPPLPD
ncbi:MAG: erythromycin esterase family protein [Thermomicrobiales bacterium]